MDNVNPDPKMLLKVVELRLIADDPFMLFDIACALGLDPAWRLFRDDLSAHGFDPQHEEFEAEHARKQPAHPLS